MFENLAPFLFNRRFRRQYPYVIRLRESLLLLYLSFIPVNVSGETSETLEKKKTMKDRARFYALPFGDLPRDGEADGDGSGLHPLLLPRRLPVPLAFSRTMVSR